MVSGAKCTKRDYLKKSLDMMISGCLRVGNSWLRAGRSGSDGQGRSLLAGGIDKEV